MNQAHHIGGIVVKVVALVITYAVVCFVMRLLLLRTRGKKQP